ncbi:hypothetical protein D3C86_1200410 [compost metagenome]
MDVALVQHPQDQVDDDEREQQQPAHAAHRVLEGLAGALELGHDPRRQHRLGGLLHQARRVAQGDARLEVEGQRRRGHLVEVGDLHRAHALLQIGHRAQGHELARRGAHLEEPQLLDGGLEGRIDLQDDLVLVGRPVDLGDLARSVGAVQGHLDLIGRHVEGGGPVAVDREGDLGSLRLEIARDVLQLRRLAQALIERLRGAVQGHRVSPLEGHLVLALARHAADSDARRILQINADARHLSELGSQRVDHLVGAQRSLAPRLEVDEEHAVVALGAEGARAGARDDALDVGVGLDDLGDLLLVPHHLGEGDAGRCLGDAHQAARVLGRDEALGDGHEGPAREDHERQGGGEAGALVAHDPGQGPGVGPGEPVEEAPSLLMVLAAVRCVGRGGLQEAAGHHGREGQGDDARQQDGPRERQGELVEQTPDDAAHEQDGDEHSHQRDRHGEDGEADFLRTLQGRGQGLLALLHVPHDVLEHDDGVVHDEARREGQGHQ